MREILLGIVLSLFLLQAAAANDDQDAASRGEKALSVFNVVTFPNTACGASNGYNGTCFTASECEAKGGTASGTCASSFGVCCVFSISCMRLIQQRKQLICRHQFLLHQLGL